jgi:hypothetical protein
MTPTQFQQQTEWSGALTLLVVAALVLAVLVGVYIYRTRDKR